MKRRRGKDVASIWEWLAGERYRLLSRTVKPSPRARVSAFRDCVERAFYDLARELAGRTVKVRYLDRPVAACRVAPTALRQLLVPLQGRERLPRTLQVQLAEAVDDWLDRQSLAPEDLGYAFERLYGIVPDECALNGARQSRDRNTKGVFYTPTDLVEELCDAAVGPMVMACKEADALKSLFVVDPAMGGGRFLLEVFDRISGQARSLGCVDREADMLALQAVHGVDRDQLAVDVGRFSLWLAAGADAASAAVLVRNLKHGDALVGSIERNREAVEDSLGEEDFNWANAFPHVFNRPSPGFDLVIGNPPWGKVKSEYKRFLTSFYEEVRGLQGAELREHMTKLAECDTRVHSAEAWSAYAGEVSDYSKKLKARYTSSDGISGRGDADLYKYFLSRSFELCRADGRVALIIPSAFRNTDGASGLRNIYLRSGRFTFFVERTNSAGHFPIHSMFRFISFTYDKGREPGIDNATFIHKNAGGPVTFSLEDLQSVGGPALLIPEVRTEREAELLGRLHSRFQPLGAPGVWSVRFVREVDMTNASKKFVSTTAAHREADVTLVPVYEGRMVGQFDYAAKEYVGGAGRTAIWRSVPLHEKRVVPHYFLPVDMAAARWRRCCEPRAAFCDITGHANFRTVLATVVPGSVVCGNKVPTCRFGPFDDPKLHLLWTAIANSIIVDWLVRRRISTTLNFFHWYSIPFPRLHPAAPEARRLIQLAASLVYIDPTNENFRAWLSKATNEAPEFLTCADERKIAISEIDAIVADLYGLTADDLEVVRRDFKPARRPKEPLSVPLEIAA